MVKQMRKIWLLLLPGCTLFAGCYKNFQVKPPEGYVKPVLNALLVRDSLLKIRVSQSTAPGDRSVVYRNDALVKFYGDDEFWGIMTLRREPRDTYFVAGPFDTGKRIRISAEVPGFPLVEGESVIPAASPDMETEIRLTIPPFGPTKFNILFRLHDPGGQRNYYRIRILPKDTAEYSRDFFYPPLELTYSGIENWGFFGDDDAREVFFDDAMFDGRVPVLRFTGESYNRMPEYEVELSHLSHEAYLYLRSLELQRRRETNDVAEKVKVFSNVRNGLGIVGGMAVRRWRVRPL